MSLFLLMAAFVLTGLNSVSNVAVGHLAGYHDPYRGIYCLGFWGGGLILGLITLAITKHEVRKHEAALGVSMGVAGAVATALLLIALRMHVQAVVAFPVRSCGNTTLTAVVSLLAWREKVTARQWLGIACGLAAIYLVVPTH